MLPILPEHKRTAIDAETLVSKKNGSIEVKVNPDTQVPDAYWVAELTEEIEGREWWVVDGHIHPVVRDTPNLARERLLSAVMSAVTDEGIDHGDMTIRSDRWIDGAYWISTEQNPQNSLWVDPTGALHPGQVEGRLADQTRDAQIQAGRAQSMEESKPEHDFGIAGIALP